MPHRHRNLDVTHCARPPEPPAIFTVDPRAVRCGPIETRGRSYRAFPISAISSSGGGARVALIDRVPPSKATRAGHAPSGRYNARSKGNVKQWDSFNNERLFTNGQCTVRLAVTLSRWGSTYRRLRRYRRLRGA